MNTDVNINQNTRNTGEIPVLPRDFKVRAFAQEIGFSHTTVYNVLNGGEKVSEENRRFILERLWDRVGHLQPAPAA